MNNEYDYMGDLDFSEACKLHTELCAACEKLGDAWITAFNSQAEIRHEISSAENIIASIMKKVHAKINAYDLPD